MEVPEAGVQKGSLAPVPLVTFRSPVKIVMGLVSSASNPTKKLMWRSPSSVGQLIQGTL
jgi:hypothetical protein